MRALDLFRKHDVLHICSLDLLQKSDQNDCFDLNVKHNGMSAEPKPINNKQSYYNP